ncbi:uncharacterized protein LOC106672658 [Cimex lectularius]|uniref:DUF4780 domain-containing protein n=1 Tax=Cimex lectularius TaxID=79782 RepID=A0A8I6S8T7_CIMLE|nr:uncharacterized protein LOC106672658 [Cimex lectularius]
MTKWYLRAIKSGKTPEEARKLADERKAKIQKEKLEVQSSSKRAISYPQRTKDRQDGKAIHPQALFRAREAAPSVSYAGAAKIIRVALLPEEYPLVTLTTEELTHLEETLIEEILKGWEAKIQFEGIHIRPDMMALDCQDGKTVQWLQEIAPKLELSKRTKLTVRVGEAFPNLTQ